MEKIILEIKECVQRDIPVDATCLQNIVRNYNKGLEKGAPSAAKRRLLPYYSQVKQNNPELWESWHIDTETEKKLLAAIQMKPRRTASGVATITVITKPWVCSSKCIYCPNDVRMPKSYMSDEPACQRAEMNYFDPYLQVAARLHVLEAMGHITDKIELIILGGTWTDYPEDYQTWFVKELFCALNDDPGTRKRVQEERSAWYEGLGLSRERSSRKHAVANTQAQVHAGQIDFNQAISELYIKDVAWSTIADKQKAGLDELTHEHKKNEGADHRVVGLVMETQPDTITHASLRHLRMLGATKVQIGIQSLDDAILAQNNRRISVEEIRRSCALLRLYGFKLHIHFMANLYGANPEADKRDYKKLVTEAYYLPDEVKLYPCALIEGTELCKHFEDGTWRPYSEEELIDLLVYDTLATPCYTRISRMIRDFSSHDIKEGNKKVNLRQLVEQAAEQQDQPIQEIRYREISTQTADISRLKLERVAYTTAISQEYFLQWVSQDAKIAGFLRLSLPDQSFVEEQPESCPIGLNEAMIREVHVYGRVAELHATNKGAQHLGLGKKLIEEAEKIAREAGYARLNVISAIGTRGYYSKLGFEDCGLYQQKLL